MDLTELKAEVERNKTVDGSAKALISQLADIIEANAQNPAELASLVAALRDDNQSLADAVLAHTPAAPTV